MTNNKLTDERVSNATLIRLIQWADQHNSHYVAAALCELQERRKADNQEPAGYHVIKECGQVGCSVATLDEAEKTRDFWNKKWTIRPYFYTAQPVPVVPEEITADGIIGMHECGFVEGWNACRAAMLHGGKNSKSLHAVKAAPVLNYSVKNIELLHADCRGKSDGNSPVIPDGYALVPVEPTDEMIAAAMECDDVVFDSKDPTAFCVQYREIYCAMVDTAPALNKGKY
ncbi:TPA: hypothetical protein N2492_003983 [Salmonella enterica]|uniref:Phage protein n=2 Tax=Salmonella enterica TaxID=28901 RepID=A0A5I2CPW1_SALET|nr:hypothetical protein [Salmonella enterica subsp. enterica serovar Mikawasima]EAC0345387.1 hypothetical protein [Salmonella enterica subsp. enterica serovar Newport]ECI4008345.1 hypothetical protein [Salmonella enterica subsp. salamae]EIO9921271.1 hypothetical protein [Salmonella enterica]EAA7373381.1 hypothetical protein [Salmonella enterica subsp. enterica serovar Mikawasima]